MSPSHSGHTHSGHMHSGHSLRPVPPLEPPTRETGPVPRHRRITGVATRRATPHDGRSGRSPGTSAEPRVDATVHRFADHALRLVLEVVDGRRPEGQLSTVLAPPLIATVAHTRRGVRAEESAVLLRARVRPVDARTAELFGSYARGTRVYAFAGRMVRPSARTRAPHGWIVTTLWLG